MSSQTPLKIIGKEFLYDENLFITNYNPFISSNHSGISGLYLPRQMKGKLFIFDKTNYNEPTKDEFRNIKNFSDMVSFRKSEQNIEDNNIFEVTITSEYDDTLNIRKIILDQSIQTLQGNINHASDGVFVVLYLYNAEDNSVVKAYDDISAKESNFMYLIPSNFISINNTDGELIFNTTNKTKYNNSLQFGSTEQISGQSLPSNLTSGILINTGKKVYLYGGKSDTSANSNNNSSNTCHVANINQDGTLSNFTNIGYDTLSLYSTCTYVYTNPENGNSWAYIFGGLSFGSSLNSTYNIRRAPILEDGSLGTWEIIDTLTGGGFNNTLISHPEDKSKFYIAHGDRYVSGNLSKYRSTVTPYQIKSDGTLIKLSLSTPGYMNYLNAQIILKDPKTLKLWLFIFGSIGELDGDSYIRKYQVLESGEISGPEIRVGNIDYPKFCTTALEDSENIYIIGGASNGYQGNYIGADNRVLKYPKDLLFSASSTNMIQPIQEQPLNIGIRATNNIIKTSLGYFIICPTVTTNTTKTVYNWQTSNKVIGLKFNTSVSDINTFSINKLNINISRNERKLLPNKLGSRILEIQYEGLLVRKPQTLLNWNESIKFIDPISKLPITIQDILNPLAIGENEKFVIDYISKLAITDHLDKYNYWYYLTFSGQNIDGKYSIIIPEIIFNILSDYNCYNLNLTVLNEYFNDPILNPETLGFTVPASFNLENSLYVLSKSKTNHSLQTPFTYTTSGINMNIQSGQPVLFNQLNKNHLDLKYICIPQRTNLNPQSLNNFVKNFPIKIPKGLNCIDKINNLSSCKIDPLKDISEIDKLDDIEYLNSFNYFLSPTGNDSNDGLTIYTPKKTLKSIPYNGQRILLLPGTYNGSHFDPIYMTTNKFYGCGNLTIIKNISLYMQSYYSNKNTPETCFFNCNFDGVNYIGFLGSYNQITSIRFIRCKFNFTGPYQYNYADNSNSCSVIFENCNFTTNGYNMVENKAYGGFYLATVVKSTTYVNTPLDNILQYTPNTIIDPNKRIIDNILSSYKFTPCYTLLPITDNSNQDSNSIILENTTNITTIPNFNIKLI